MNEWGTFNQTNTGSLSKATLRKRLTEEVNVIIWVFKSCSELNGAQTLITKSVQNVLGQCQVRASWKLISEVELALTLLL